MLRCISAVLLACFATNVRAAPRAETLLPQNVAAYVRIANVPALREAWAQTQLGRLLADDAMADFRGDLAEQLRERILPGGADLEVTWSEVAEVATGEAALAVLQPDADSKAAVLLVDVTSMTSKAEELVRRMGAKLVERGADESIREANDVQIATYQLPPREGKERRRFKEAVFAVHRNLFVASDSFAAAAAVLARVDSAGRDNLANLASFQAVKQATAVEPDVHLQWYINPFALAETQRAVRGGGFVRDRDLLQILQNQGFDAIKAVGGQVYLGDGERQVTHRTLVYAPGAGLTGAGLTGAARALNFPNGPQKGLPAWTPREIVGATALNINVQAAFSEIGGLIDEWYRVDENDKQEFFHDLLDDLALDPTGPKVDLRTDVVAKLGSRALVLTDVKATENGSAVNADQMLVAVEALDPAALSEAIDRLEASDPTAVRHSIGDDWAWEVPPARESAPRGRSRGSRSRPSPRKTLPTQIPLQSSGVAVAHGYLMISSHYELLARVVAAGSPPLTDSVDYQRVETEIGELGGDATCVRSFVRRAEANRSNYSLLGQGRMPQSRTLLGHALNIVFATEDGSTREALIDGKLLPDYDVVQRYLGPGGCFVVSQDDGWLVTGFTLSKQ